VYVKAQHFPRFAFSDDFKRSATNLTIGREALPGDARINDQLDCLSAKWTLDFFENFHA
jgi:hypothetical protein